MDRLQYLLESAAEKRPHEKLWIIRAFTVCNWPKKEETSSPVPYDLYQSDESELLYTYVPVEGQDGEFIPIAASSTKEPLLRYVDRMKVMPGYLPNITEAFETTVGNFLVNVIVFVYAFGAKIPFVKGKISGKVENMLAEKFEDPPEKDSDRKPDKIYHDEHIRYCEGMSALGGLAEINVPSASPKVLTINPAILKRKDELFELHKDNLDDPAVMATIMAELAKMDKEDFKGDPAENFFIKSKSFDVQRMRLYIMYGLEAGFGVDEEGSAFIAQPLSDGWDPQYLPQMNDGTRNGSFLRGNQTALGGTRVKELYRAFQNSRIIMQECGAKHGMKWVVLSDLIKKGFYKGRYFVHPASRIVMPCTDENLQPFVGKTIEVRSPMLCNAKAPSFCAICAGDLLSITPTGIPIAMSDIGSIFMNTFMKAMHGKALQTATYKAINFV